MQGECIYFAVPDRDPSRDLCPRGSFSHFTAEGVKAERFCITCPFHPACLWQNYNASQPLDPSGTQLPRVMESKTSKVQYERLPVIFFFPRICGGIQIVIH